MSMTADDGRGDYKHPTDSALDFDWLVYCRVCAKPLSFDGRRYLCANQGCSEYVPQAPASTDAAPPADRRG